MNNNRCRSCRKPGEKLKGFLRIISVLIRIVLFVMQIIGLIQGRNRRGIWWVIA